MDQPLGTLIYVGLTFLLAGFVKGVIGLGLPTVGIGLLSVMLAPAQAAALLTIPTVVTNCWQLVGPQFVPLVRRLWPMFAGICVGNWLGAGLITTGDANHTLIALGLVLTLYAV